MLPVLVQLASSYASRLLSNDLNLTSSSLWSECPDVAAPPRRPDLRTHPRELRATSLDDLIQAEELVEVADVAARRARGAQARRRASRRPLGRWRSRSASRAAPIVIGLLCAAFIVPALAEMQGWMRSTFSVDERALSITAPSDDPHTLASIYGLLAFASVGVAIITLQTLARVRSEQRAQRQPLACLAASSAGRAGASPVSSRG